VDDITSQHEGVVEGCESIQTGPEECVKLNTVRDYKCVKMLCGCYLSFAPPPPVRQPETAVTFCVIFLRSWNLNMALELCFGEIHLHRQIFPMYCS